MKSPDLKCCMHCMTWKSARMQIVQEDLFVGYMYLKTAEAHICKSCTNCCISVQRQGKVQRSCGMQQVQLLGTTDAVGHCVRVHRCRVMLGGGRAQKMYCSPSAALHVAMDTYTGYQQVVIPAYVCCVCPSITQTTSSTANPNEVKLY